MYYETNSTSPLFNQLSYAKYVRAEQKYFCFCLDQERCLSLFQHMYKPAPIYLSSLLHYIYINILCKLLFDL